MMTCYGLDGPRIESRYGRDTPHPSSPALGSTQPLFSGSKSPSRKQGSRGVALTIHPILASRLKKEQSYTSTPPLSLHGLF